MKQLLICALILLSLNSLTAAEKIFLCRQDMILTDWVTVNPDGTELKTISGNLGVNENAQITTDHKSVYCMDLDGFDSAVFRCDLPSKNKTKISSGIDTSKVRLTAFSLSRNSGNLIFSVTPKEYQQGSYFDQDVYLCNTDGSNLQHIAHGNSWDNYPPLMSSDLKKLLYSRKSGGIHQYTITDLETGVVRVIFEGANASKFSFSPDGSKALCAVRDKQSGKFSLVVINSDGSKNVIYSQGALLDKNESIDSTVISPDGTKAAFVLVNLSSYCASAVCTINLDGSSPKIIVKAVPDRSYTVCDWR